MIEALLGSIPPPQLRRQVLTRRCLLALAGVGDDLRRFDALVGDRFLAFGKLLLISALHKSLSRQAILQGVATLRTLSRLPGDPRLRRRRKPGLIGAYTVAMKAQPPGQRGLSDFPTPLGEPFGVGIGDLSRLVTGEIEINVGRKSIKLCPVRGVQIHMPRWLKKPPRR